MNTGAEIRTFKGHKKWVSSVAFSPDGNSLASASADKTAIFWNLTTGEILDTFKHDDEIRSIAFSPSGDIFATGSNDMSIKLWLVGNKEQLCILRGHANDIRYIAFDPTEKLLASSSYNNDIIL